MPNDNLTNNGSAQDEKNVPSSPATAGPDASAPRLRRLALVFRGQVQGVAFRWTADIAARATGCTGWVRNEPDGSVAMELQGTDDQVSNFFGEFAAVRADFPIDYRIAEKDDIPIIKAEARFRVLR